MLIRYHCNNYHNKLPSSSAGTKYYETVEKAYEHCCRCLLTIFGSIYDQDCKYHPKVVDNYQKIINIMDIHSILQNDTVRLLAGLVIQMLLSYPIRFVQPRLVRYAYSTVAGTLLQYWVFGLPVGWIYVFGAAMYALTLGLPGRCGGLVTFLGMVFLSSYHLSAILYRYGEETMDQIVLLMILICKYSLFAYAYQDNYLASLGRIDSSKISKQRKDNQITERVSILDYFGYLQFLPTSIMGPPIEYRTYRNFMEQEQQFAKIPSPAPALIKVAKQFAICGFFYVLSIFVFPASYMKTDEFWENGILGVGTYSFIALTLFRFKFYTGWNVSISSIHICGVSYTPEGTFTGITHCNPYVVETTPHIREKIGSWNIMVQEWLRKCIYQRSPFKSRMISQLYVFLVSAFWHGYYVGYYFSFTLWFVQLYLQGQIFKYTKIEGNFLSKLYRGLGAAGPFIAIFVSNWFFSHNATYFYLLESNLCFKLMAKMYFLPPLILIAGVIVFMVLPAPRRKEKRAE